MIKESQLNELENQLKTIFKAVSPDPDFEKKLKKKLFSDSDILLERKPTPFFILLTALSVLLPIFLLIFLRRHNIKSSL